MSNNMSLSDFIENNYKLIASLGVFIALALFAKTIKVDILYVTFIIQAILIWLEIYMKIPVNTPAFSKISIFESAFIFPIGYIIYDFLEGKSLLEIIIYLIFMIAIAVSLVVLSIKKKN